MEQPLDGATPKPPTEPITEPTSERSLESITEPTSELSPEPITEPDTAPDTEPDTEPERVDALTALTRLGGVADARTLFAASSRHRVETALARREIIRLSQGRYCLPSVDQARASAHVVGGVVSHLSAALHWGWPVKFPPPLPMVTVPRHRNVARKRCDGIDVRRAEVDTDDLDAGVTGRVRTVIDCSRHLPFDEALAVADSALRSGDVSKDELTAAANASPRTGRRAALRVAEAADGRAAGPFESVLRAIARGVPGLLVVPQYPIADIGYADLADPDLRLATEADSYEFHAGRGAFRADVHRYNAFVRDGWVVLRFLWADVMHQPDYVRAVLTDVVALASND